MLMQVRSEWPIGVGGDPLVEEQLPVEVEVARRAAPARRPVDVGVLDEPVGDPDRAGVTQASRLPSAGDQESCASASCGAHLFTSGPLSVRLDASTGHHLASCRRARRPSRQTAAFEESSSGCGSRAGRARRPRAVDDVRIELRPGVPGRSSRDRLVPRDRRAVRAVGRSSRRARRRRRRSARRPGCRAPASPSG